MAANEELLDKQKEVPDILIPLLERIYNNARYGLMSGLAIQHQGLMDQVLESGI